MRENHDEVNLFVKRRAGIYRLGDDATGKIARDEQNQPVDQGGYRRKSQAYRQARGIESMSRWALKAQRLVAARRASAEYARRQAERGVVSIDDATRALTEDGYVVLNKYGEPGESCALSVVDVDRDNGVVVLGVDGDRR